MSDTTTHLGLPYLMAAQAQKHVTHMRRCGCWMGWFSLRSSHAI